MAHLLHIQQVERTATDTVTLYFNKPPRFGFYLPGQHVLLSANIAGEQVSRTYSLCSSPYLDGQLALTIRQIPEGKLSTYLVKEARKGMEVALDGPYGSFVTAPDPKQERHLLLFAGGSGITPLYSMLRSVLYQEPRSVVSLIYANHAADRIIFREQLQELEALFPGRLTVFHAISEPESFTGEPGYLIKGPLSRLLVRKLTQLQLERHRQQAAFYLCGPAAFMEMVEAAVRSLGLEAPAILKEHFHHDGQGTEATLRSLPARDVIVAWEGHRQCVTVPSGKSILQAALEQGLPLPHSCKEGLCGVCRSNLVSGIVQMQRNSILTTEELAAGQVLLCQGYALSDGVEVCPVSVPENV